MNEQNLEKLIRQCLAGDRKAQYALYQAYAPAMLGLCLRYTRERNEAEDVLQEGFIRMFTALPTFKFAGSFAGWLRRIMVHTALRYLQKHRQQQSVLVDLDPAEVPLTTLSEAEPQLSAEELLAMIHRLPEGYRLVFNLHVIEGYDHQEIAGMLDIQEATSRSQLFKARQMLKSFIAQSQKTVEA